MSWDALYGMLMAECGYTWEYIDQHMTLPKLSALMARWKIIPPLSVTLASIAAGLGINLTNKETNPAEALAHARMLNQQGAG